MDYETSDREREPHLNDLPGVKDVIRSVSFDEPRGEIIGKIASSCCYVREEEKISGVADKMARNDAIHAVGVVDAAMRPKGVLVRRELFDILGKQFGRDLYINKTVESVMRRTVAYDRATSIYGVADELAGRLGAAGEEFFLLTTGENRFGGIFSNRDMLIYLSERTQKDIDLARRLQSRIVSGERFEESGLCSVVSGSIMAKGVGGDYYSVRRPEQGKWLIVLCDVMGKGIAASLITAVIGGMLASYDCSRGLRGFVSALNDYIFTTFEAERFVTGMFLEYDERTRGIIVYDTGHSMMFICRNDRLVRVTTPNSTIPIGVSADLNPTGSRFSLREDDLLVLATDGVIEQTNSSADAYGELRLAGIIKRHRRDGLLKIKDELFADIARFRSGQPQHDDMTIVMLETKTIDLK